MSERKAWIPIAAMLDTPIPQALYDIAQQAAVPASAMQLRVLYARLGEQGARQWLQASINALEEGQAQAVRHEIERVAQQYAGLDLVTTPELDSIVALVTAYHWLRNLLPQRKVSLQFVLWHSASDQRRLRPNTPALVFASSPHFYQIDSILREHAAPIFLFTPRDLEFCELAPNVVRVNADSLLLSHRYGTGAVAPLSAAVFPPHTEQTQAWLAGLITLALIDRAASARVPMHHAWLVRGLRAIQSNEHAVFRAMQDQLAKPAEARFLTPRFILQHWLPMLNLALLSGQASKVLNGLYGVQLAQNFATIRDTANDALSQMNQYTSQLREEYDLDRVIRNAPDGIVHLSTAAPPSLLPFMVLRARSILPIELREHISMMMLTHQAHDAQDRTQSLVWLRGDMDPMIARDQLRQQGFEVWTLPRHLVIRGKADNLDQAVEALRQAINVSAQQPRTWHVDIQYDASPQELYRFSHALLGPYIPDDRTWQQPRILVTNARDLRYENGSLMWRTPDTPVYCSATASARIKARLGAVNSTPYLLIILTETNEGGSRLYVGDVLSPEDIVIADRAPYYSRPATELDSGFAPAAA